jgi:hypothetical protein
VDLNRHLSSLEGDATDSTIIEEEEELEQVHNASSQTHC